MMSDDEADPELLELLRQSLGMSKKPNDEISSETGKLPSPRAFAEMASIQRPF